VQIWCLAFTIFGVLGLEKSDYFADPKILELLGEVLMLSPSIFGQF
jgi:hypothetical protein